MSESTGFFSTLGRRITQARTFVVNSVFVVIVLSIVISLLGGDERPSLRDNSALIIRPMGMIVEQTVAPRNWQDALFQDSSNAVIEIGDILHAIEIAGTDEKIKMIVLNLDDLYGVSLTQAKRIVSALHAFKESGKKVVSYGNVFEQNQYYIASSASEIYMNPWGQMLLQGYGGNNLYLKDLLAKLDINMHIFRVGEFKSATEPFSRINMSDEARQASTSLYEGIWQELVEGIAENRQLTSTEVNNYAQNFDTLLAKTNGDMARTALEANLIDELLTADQVETRIAAVVGRHEDEINGIGMGAYLNMRDLTDEASDDAAQIGVIVVQGAILEEGQGLSNVASAEDLVGRIRQARFNEDIRALVVRVDSPGGSAFASELIRQELELFQVTGRPVVASFANVAASGGYWISATSDAIIAESATITGSIGIFGVVPTFEKSLDRIGVYSDGVGTAPLARGSSSLAGLNQHTKNILQASVEFGYGQFIDLVARGRDMSKAEVEKVAQGRVWQGSKALELGLVDALGGVDVALTKAADLAGLEQWTAIDLRRSLDPQSLFLMQMMDSFGLQLSANTHPWLRSIQEQLSTLAMFTDRRHTFALCLACAN
ncbi:MAG: protease-4 [Candidatus Azotimanducaceae bacterium]|jgi:protease-4|tara:strand:- start:850 stop:2658 length:1809 start_codon:yes stop_codon:yes gene_type:complete